MANSYRQIIRSSSIIGGASIINILLGLIRTKIAAVLLGPVGLGLIGLLQSLMGTASAISSLGLGTIGTRQVAEANSCGEPSALVATRKALFWGTLALAVTGGTIFWLLRDVLTQQMFGGTENAGLVGWLALGVALAVASSSQGALLNGLRRIGDIARVSVLSAAASSVIGIAALWLWGEGGVLIFVLSTPLASFVISHAYVSRLPKVAVINVTFSQLSAQWKIFARLGAAFMVSGLAVSLGQLAVRAMVQREIGVEAVGHFQAAATISMTYIGFILQAMSTDYYPRLTAVMHDKSAVNQMVNEQTEVALVLAGPIFLAMLGLAPWVISLLYSSQFSEAVEVLRWQILGDILKVGSWPLGFIILAAGDGRTFMFAEILAIAIFVFLTWIALPLVGIEATGIAFLGMYLGSLPLVFFLARRRTGFAWEPRIQKHLFLVVVSAIAIFLVSYQSKLICAVLSVTAAIFFSIYGLVRLSEMVTFGGPVAMLAEYSRKILSRIWLRHD